MIFQSLKGEYLNLTAVGVVFGIFYAAYLMQLGASDSTAWRILLMSGIAISFFAAMFNFWRLRKITEAPVSTIAAAAQGYIELQGSVSSIKPLQTPFHGIPCVWYRSWVYANRKKHHSRGASVDDVRLLEYTENSEIFQLKDSSGTCAINPKGAEVLYATKKTYYKNDHRYVEEFLPVSKRLYVLGYLDTLQEYNTENAIKSDVGKLLAEWKSNPNKLHLRFDQNRDGKIDMQEWEAAREQAQQEVETKHLMQAHTQSYTITKPAQKHLYIISALSPQELRNKYKFWSIGHLFMLFVLLIVYYKLSL